MALLRELCQGPQPEWESRCKTNAGEDPEKWEAVLIVDGNVSWSRKSVWHFLCLLNDNLWPGCPIPGHILKGLYIPQWVTAGWCHSTSWSLMPPQLPQLHLAITVMLPPPPQKMGCSLSKPWVKINTSLRLFLSDVYQSKSSQQTSVFGTNLSVFVIHLLPWSFDLLMWPLASVRSFWSSLVWSGLLGPKHISVQNNILPWLWFSTAK